MIEIRDVHKSFGDFRVLKGVNLTIPKGKITVIIGSSGCGKSVLLRHMIGLLSPDRGEVIVDGVDLQKLSDDGINDFRRRFGMLFQHAALFDSLNVFDNVAFPIIESCRGKRLPDVKSIVDKKLSLVGLSGIDEKMPSELSGGMRKRVGLARAIALEPAIVLYDEPTTGLDPIMTDAIDNLILSMQRELAITSVVISHDIGAALTVADQIAMLHDGKIIECTDPETFRKSNNPVITEFLNAGGRLSKY